MKKKTTWAASVVKKQLQTCCKHQTFSMETTERDDCTSQGFGSPSRVIHISSPIRETADPILQRRKSFNVLHGRSLLTTPEPLTPFRKSVESAIPLCRSSTFKSQRLQNVDKSSPELAGRPPPSKGPKVVLHKSGPLPVLQQLLRGHQGSGIASPLNVKKQLSGPLLGRPPSPKQPTIGGPSPTQRISKVKFSPTPRDVVAKHKHHPHGNNSAPVITEESEALNPKVTQIVLVKVRKQSTPDERAGCRESPSSKSVGHPPASSPQAKSATEFAPPEHGEECGNVIHVRDENDERNPKPADRDYVSAAVKIQAAYRGHQTRNKLANGELQRGSANPSEDEPGEEELEVEEAPSISTQMSRTDPLKQRRNPLPRVNKGWNGSIRSAQDHQALLRSRQEAALKRERAMEYALSRQRWRAGSKGPSKGPGWITDDRLPDKPGWVRNWLERATRMSAQNSQNRVFNNEFEHNNGAPESESLSMKSTVGMCTTDIGSVEVNLGWPLSLRQQHAAGLLQSNKAPAIPEPPPLQTVATPPPPPQPSKLRSKRAVAKLNCHKFQLRAQFNEFSSSTADSGIVSPPTSEESRHDRANPEEIEESEGRNYCGIHDSSSDRESVGSCEGPVPITTLTKAPSPVVVVATKPRLQQQQQQHKVSNSNSQKEAAKLREKLLALHPQSQVSVALSDGNSADTTAASIQRPLWR